MKAMRLTLGSEVFYKMLSMQNPELGLITSCLPFAVDDHSCDNRIYLTCIVLSCC